MLNDNELILNSLLSNIIPSEDFQLSPDENSNNFILHCNSISENPYYDDTITEEDLELPSNINSKYYDISEFNNIKPDPSSSFGLLHTNLASLNKHIDDLKLSLSLFNFNFDIIGITEHKIQNNGPTSNIEIPGYHPFLYDPIDTSHGGTGFFIKDSHAFIERNDLKFNSPGNHESIFIELIFPNKKNLIVGCIYRHPTSTLTIEQFTKLYIEPVLDKITSENKLCSLVGDFNIDLLKTDEHDGTNLFFNNMSSNFFAPYILQPTRLQSKTLIDNILINSVEYNSYSGNITIQISDHLLQFVILEGFFKDIVPRKIKIYERNFKNFNEREFAESLNAMDWDTILSYNKNDANLSMECLYNSINYLLDEFAPFKKITKKVFKLKSKPWITKEILAKIHERDKLLHKFTKEKDPLVKHTIYNEYKLLRNSLTRMKRDSKSNYYKNYFETHKFKASSIWKGIRSLVKISSTSKRDIRIMDENGSYVSDPTKISNLFNKFYVNIGPSIDSNIPQPNHSYREYLRNIKINKNFFLFPTSPAEVFNIIISLDMNKSLGPNSVPVYILKSFNNFFSDKLSKIINISFITGVFPDLCKLAKVIPIFKKDNQLLCKNYRPISLLPIFSKIFEKVIYTRMYAYLNDNDLIYNRQFGFRSKHSTGHALISSIESIKKFMDSGHIVGGVYIDLQKAFDTVNHQILCDKLSFYGFRGKTQQLIQSFLSHRQQFVSINGFDSSKLDIKCGVPQGSTLGPLLFLIYINDLRYCLTKSTSSHFADDTCIMYASKKMKTLETILNTDLKSVSEWLKANRLSLNIDKTKLLIFHSKKKKNFDVNSISIKIDRKKLVPSQNVKYLGAHIDENLSWDFHVNQLSKKLSRANGILAKLRHFAPKDTLISVYYSIFYSHVIYACPTWSLTSIENLNIIKVLQKKCLRIINFAPFNSHTNDLFINNKLLKLDDIIKTEKLKVVFDFINNNLPDELMNLFLFNSDINLHSTRNVIKKGLFLPTINTVTYGNKSLRFSASVLWNDHIKKCKCKDIKTVGHFKAHLKKHFSSLY